MLEGSRFLFVALVAMLGFGQSAEPARAQLAAVQLRIAEVADSGTYFVYRYSLTNAPTSAWSVAGVRIGVRATSGTPANLPATGNFFDATTRARASTPVQPYAAVGPISPAQWGASLSLDADLSWSAPSSGATHLDSVAPGMTLDGIAVRSPYLPGVTEAMATPTWQACCSVADTLTGRNPRVGEFAARSRTIAPRYAPAELNGDVLTVELRSACEELQWMNSSTLCERLAELASSGDPSSLADFVTELEAAQQTGRIASDAYLLLGMLAKALLAPAPA